MSAAEASSRAYAAAAAAGLVSGWPASPAVKQMKTGTQVLELGVACALLAYELAVRVGWSADVGPIGPFWIRLILPCLLLFPIKAREVAYWLDRVVWAAAIGLFLNDNALPRDFWIVRVILWSYLGMRAAVALWKCSHARAHA